MTPIVSRELRSLSVLFNLTILLVIVPVFLFSLLEYVYLGHLGLRLDSSLSGIVSGAATLVFWHMFVREHVIKIRRRWVLFLVRLIKSALVFAIWLWFTMSSNLDMPFRAPIFLTSILGGSLVYAGLRHFFAPRYRI